MMAVQIITSGQQQINSIRSTVTIGGSGKALKALSIAEAMVKITQAAVKASNSIEYPKWHKK